MHRFVRLFGTTCVISGLVLLFLGWQWGRGRSYSWKGNLEYTPRNTEEIPRPLDQVFENYVADQWPFVIATGVVLAACGSLCLTHSWHKQTMK